MCARDGKLQPASWDEAFAAIAKRLAGRRRAPHRRHRRRPRRRRGDVGAQGPDGRARLAEPRLPPGRRRARSAAARAAICSTRRIAGIEQADAILLIGTNPRWEAPILNARIRKRCLQGGVQDRRDRAAARPDLSGTSIWAPGRRRWREIADGRHRLRRGAEGGEAPDADPRRRARCARPDGAAILRSRPARWPQACGLVREGWNGFNVLHTAAARVGGLDLGFVPAAGGRDVAGILAGAAQGRDRGRLSARRRRDRHGASSARPSSSIRATMAMPARTAPMSSCRAPPTPKSPRTYVNTEGRVQRATLAAFPPGEAREDWTIMRALSDVLGRTLPFDTHEPVARRLFAANPRFQRAGYRAAGGLGRVRPAGQDRCGGRSRSPIANFYMTDPISRASETMAQCTEAFGAATGAEDGHPWIVF